jgi:hypothetical protein
LVDLVPRRSYSWRVVWGGVLHSLCESLYDSSVKMFWYKSVCFVLSYSIWEKYEGCFADGHSPFPPLYV